MSYRFRISGMLLLLTLVLAVPAAAQVDSLQATGPELGTRLEDRVSLLWTTASPVDATSFFTIRRDTVLIAVVASSESTYDDLTAAPNVTYDYSVGVRTAAGVETKIDDDLGGRVIGRPTGFTASDGVYEDQVLLSWTDRSEIEGGFNIYRDAGYALTLDGSNDYVSTPGTTALPASFTFEFWAARGSNGTSDFIVNLESIPQGNPTNVDLEIGFNNLNQFTVAFGNNILATAAAYTDAGWHHWAVTYSASSQRRRIYRDGVQVATDVYTSVYTPSGDLEFGRRESGGSPANRGYYGGKVDELRLWSRALTAAEIGPLMTDLLDGAEPDFANYWPMDVATGAAVPDVVGGLGGTLNNAGPGAWGPTGVPDDFRATIGPDLSFYSDRTAVPGFESYAYLVAAFEDMDGDGAFTPGVDFESQRRDDTGWRASLSPPGNVSATDGQFLDRVRVTWADRSDSEDGFNIYRDNVLIGTVAADSVRFDDLAATTVHEYCVAATNGVESVRVCDDGRAGGLAPPTDVTATDSTFDDRIQVAWADTSDAEDGFQVFREGVLIATTAPNAQEYNDFTAVQDSTYEYCVQAVSTADPENPSTSTQNCDDGYREIVLAPTGLTASSGDFEDRVELSWSNPSTTAMLFQVYRDSTLIDVLAFNMTQAIDMDIASGVEYTYAVAAATVVAPSSATSSTQERVTQILEQIHHDDAVRLETGGAALSPRAKLAQVYAALDVDAAGKTTGATGFIESAWVVDSTGSRLIAPPTAVDASDNAFEDHVQIEWQDNSAVESNYVILRDGTAIDTLSANRTTYGDYTGVSGTTYTYAVLAIDDLGASTADTDPGTRTLNPPTQLSASDGASETDVFLAWKDNSSAEQGYRVYRRVMGETDSTLVGTTGRNEPAFTDPVPDSLLGVTSTYSIVAFDAFGESVRAFDEGNTQIVAPANLNASDVYEDSVVVVWVDKSAIEDGYRLTRRLKNTQTTDLDTTLAANATTFGENPGTTQTYVYCVSAFLNSTGGTIYSPEICDEGRRLGADDGGPVSSATATKVTNPGTASDRLGTSVAIDTSGNVLAGAPGAGTDGEGTVPRYTVSALNVFTLAQTWEPDTLAIDEDQFGWSVDIDGEYAVVGDPTFDNDANGNYAFYKHDGSGGWTLLEEINQNDDASGHNSNAGFSVAVSDTFVIIGDNEFDNNLPQLGGGALVCILEGGSECNRGSGAPKLEEIEEVLEIENGEFGYAVDIAVGASRVYAIVGQPGGDFAYIFDCALTDGCEDIEDWDLVRRVTQFEPGDGFGTSVAITPEFALVGAPGAQRVQVYQRVGTDWEDLTVLSPDSPADEFGAAVALFGNNALVGAPGESISGLEDAGAVYAYEWNSSAGSWTGPNRFDARAAGDPGEGDRFGESVAVGEGFYLAGAPQDDDAGINAGAFYSIPFEFTPIDPVLDDLEPPTGITASDGSPEDRIRIRWSDESDGEDGHLIYRSDDDGAIEVFADVPPNVEFYDDFEAEPGAAYTYCVAAFIGNATTSRLCDVGWLPPNGTISGRIATREGGATEDAEVCLNPNPNKALLFDGAGSYIEVTDSDSLDLTNGFTVEAWIRPDAVNGVRRIVSKRGAYGFGVKDGGLRFTTYGVKDYDLTLTPALAPDVWVHVAAVMNSSNGVTFYVNGVQQGSTISGTAAAGTSANNLFLGQDGSGIEFFAGEIDEVRIWNVERSATDLAALRTEPLIGDEEGLTGYWPLDQGERLVVPDVTPSANHGFLMGGVYVVDDGAPLAVCAVSDLEGNYSLARVRYGESTEFTVTPMREDREFEPGFKKITLSTESPIQNEVGFNDVTAFTVAGRVIYEDVLSDTTLVCPVIEAEIHVDKENIVNNENLKITTGADGSYAISVDPSIDASDPWYIIPRYVNPDDDEVVHAFSPASAERVVQDNIFDLDFRDTRRHTLSGHFTGGDPDLCGKDIGTAQIRIYTQDGCYDNILTVDSNVDDGEFEIDLPPLEYLVEVVEITGAPASRAAEIDAFFEELGTLEVDLTLGDVERDLIYRAPIVVTIEGLEPVMCGNNADEITLLDEEDNVIRTLPLVPTIGEGSAVPLTIRVEEDYGGEDNRCDVDEGTVTIFDAIADRVDVDSTMTISNGRVPYTTFGATPNVFAGARIDGVDRSFQKPFTVVARVEGREPVTESAWALVEGIRARTATFVSATTEEFPLLILHDPPGSESYAFLEEGTTMCTRFSKTTLLGGGAGLSLDLRFGFKQSTIFGTPLTGFTLETGGGFVIGARGIAGQDVTSLDGEPEDNREICLTTTEAFSTSDDPTWTSEDIYVGTALNLIFALADDLSFDDAMCKVNLAEVLAMDLDEAEPFETTYVYGESHIELSLIPELENLARIAGGDQTIEGEIDGSEEMVSLQQAIDNWNEHLETNAELKEEALEDPEVNRSFSGGTEFTYTETRDTTTVTSFESTRIYIEGEGHVGGVLTLFGFDQEIFALFEVRREWVTEEEGTEGSSKTVGYVLKDGDTGDYFSVDVGKDPRYKTPVFGTRSGRSSNPCESNTQCRDNPKIDVFPPVLFNVDPEGAGSFNLILTNASESDERRPYIMAIPGETNPRNLVATVTGDILGGARLETWLLDPGKSLTVNLDVYPSPSAFAYEDVGVVLYPEAELDIWKADPRQPFALADTAFFSVYFDSTGGGAMASLMNEGWTWFSLNREGGNPNAVLQNIPARHGDLLRSQTAESRYDSTAGWTGELSELAPGQGYRIRLQEPAVFRIEGEALDDPDPIALAPGWNWIGYLPRKALPIDDALASLTDKVQEGDAIVGQRAFAQYVSGTGWVGTLDALAPGESYALHLSAGGELRYPTDLENAIRPTVTARERAASGPVWDIKPERFDASMTMVAEVQFEGTPLDHTTTRVAVFSGDSLRGVGDLYHVEALDRHLAFVQIYGGFEAEEEPLIVHAYDAESNAVYERVGQLTYEAQTTLGEPAAPVVIELTAAGDAPELLDVPETFALHQNYPNPFNPTTTIAYDLPEANHVTINVYDVLGRHVTTLIDSEHRAGRHKVVFDASMLASGFYVYRLKAGDFSRVHKMILVK